MIYPSSSLRDKWVEKLRDRYLVTFTDKDRAAHNRAFTHYRADVYCLENCDISNKVCLQSMDYILEDEMKKLFAKITLPIMDRKVTALYFGGNTK